MSKLLAMMMKPKNYMYATIKGSLTESPTGVFSNFSASNYLELQNQITLSKDSNIEIVEKINKPSNKGSNSFVGTISRHGFVVQGTNNGNIAVFIGNGNSWSVTGDSGKTGTIVLNNDTEYYIKIKIANGFFNVLYSTDNINYTSDISVDISSLTTEQQYTLGFGIARLSTSYFNGTIDLNETYIKINNTKYQLQAVVGYTVVGSPTITDGVVSGFSENDYLSLPAITLGKKDFEFVVKLKPSTISTQRILTDNNAGSYFTGVIIRNSTGEIQACVWNGTTHRVVNSGENNVIQTNSTYYVKFYRAGTKLGVGISANGVTYTTNAIDINESDNFIFYANKTLLIGATPEYGTPFAGSIDLNETYIKINNKLWFNGQPAE